MGCKFSKNVQVQPVSAAELKHDNTKGGQHCEFQIDEKTGEKIKKNDRKKSGKDRNSNDRGLSAASKASKQSADSGLGGDDGGCVDGMITENSDAAIRDLGIIGKACPQRLSASNKSRREEESIMQSLREEGLITKPKAAASGYCTFEIVDAKLGNLPPITRPPLRLEKLEKKKKKKKPMTEEQIKEKLERAERRRKRKERERLEKIKVVSEKGHDGSTNLEQFAESVKAKEVQQQQKMETVDENRQKKLNEIREKNRLREEKRLLVRRRKQQLQAENQTMNSTEFDNQGYNAENEPL